MGALPLGLGRGRCSRASIGVISTGRGVDGLRNAVRARQVPVDQAQGRFAGERGRGPGADNSL